MNKGYNEIQKNEWLKMLTQMSLSEYPQSPLNGTPTCSIHSSIALHKIHIASQEESGCVWSSIALHSPPSIWDVNYTFP